MVLQDTIPVPSPDEPTPENTGHIHWALNRPAREDAEPIQCQPHLAGCSASQHGVDPSPASRGHGGLPTAGNACTKRQSANASHRATCSSDKSDEASLRGPDSYVATTATGKSSNVLTSEVDESLERRPSVSSFRSDQHVEMVPWLSRQVTIGRNSNFHGLSAQDREELGGIEYRSLKILLKILIGKWPRWAAAICMCLLLTCITGLFLGLHTIGVIGLLPWIMHGPSHYREYLASQGQDKVWW